MATSAPRTTVCGHGTSGTIDGSERRRHVTRNSPVPAHEGSERHTRDVTCYDAVGDLRSFRGQ